MIYAIIATNSQVAMLARYILFETHRLLPERVIFEFYQGGRCPNISKLLFTPLGVCVKERLCLGNQD